MFTPIKDRIEYGGAMIGKEERDAILSVIDSQGGRRWTIGPESLALEKELAEVTGVKRAVVVNSGSSALLIAIASLKLPKGSKIIIPAVNFPTAFNAIVQNGHVPVVVDVDVQTLNIDLKEVKKAIKKYKIAAVIAVHIAGNIVDLPALRKIVGKKVKIISDNCDGYGGTLNGKFIDAYADVSCISMHAAHIITMGEGGAILTNDKKLADTAIKMREWGRASGTDKIYKYPGFPNDYKERYVYEEMGYNLKPLELQCAMGRVQLRRLSEFVDARRKNYELMRRAVGGRSVLHIVGSTTGKPCWFSFPLIVKNRKKVMRVLEKNNIECRTIFSGNITLHPAYKDVKYHKIGQLPASSFIMSHGMFLSVHPSITQEMITFITEVFNTL